MKLRVYFAIILGLSLMFAACKDDNSVNPPGGGDTGNYFPNNDGAYYKYNLESRILQEQNREQEQPGIQGLQHSVVRHISSRLTQL
jgi:hypothetical protein